MKTLKLLLWSLIMLFNSIGTQAQLFETQFIESFSVTTDLNCLMIYRASCRFNDLERIKSLCR